MIETCRSQRHVIRSSQDRLPDGSCRRCAALRQRAYRARRTDELTRLRELVEGLAQIS